MGVGVCVWCSECQVGNNGDVTVGCGIGVIWVEDEGAEIVSGSKSSIGVGVERGWREGVGEDEVRGEDEDEDDV